ncbi:Leucine carboxyl methyltransferase 1 [Talaromyces atroroseus]|uniref:Leucine carboxyl methyltransferase 1 n=1 Tax=Talaromyces atroroseus TaxID=1441469 RepID=A0A225B1U8_TALAT|nr:Leucine carboxyl methyltransferase 1 [Talaromyces atroroseus]OKL63678.1 Leucine carboxyl methyltransferase 1 [Talaromyces atroroseus]
MSASQIPNLNTLRRGGGGLRGRLRARGRGSGAPSEDDSPQSQTRSAAEQDRIIQGTDNDASVSRLSAVELGYLDDVFAKILTPAAPGSRRFPIINRGTYARTSAIDELVNRFLEDDEGHPTKKQIISLGGGSDTRPFRIFSEKQPSSLVYHELDFSINTSAKVKAIRSSPLLRRTVQVRSEAQHSSGDMMITPAGDALHLPNYHIHPIDLRLLAAEADKVSANGAESNTTSTSTQNILPGVDTSLPTLLISECCLTYLSPHDADAVVDYFARTLFPFTTPLGLIIYEPIRPEDAFGKTMVSNLAARGIHLQTLHKYSSLPAQRQRLLDHGFQTGQGAVDVDFIWNNWISGAEKERVATLEMLDEIEEWRLLAQHYCVAWGWRNVSNDREFSSWKQIKRE